MGITWKAMGIYGKFPREMETGKTGNFPWPGYSDHIYMITFTPKKNGKTADIMILASTFLGERAKL